MGSIMQMMGNLFQARGKSIGNVHSWEEGWVVVVGGW